MKNRESQTCIARKRQLLEKHPDLDQIDIVSLSESGLPLSQVSNFINVCWEADYGDEAHITFAPEFLECNSPDAATSLLALNRSEICGLFLAFPQTFKYTDKTFFVAACTGLSVHPDFRCGGNHGFSGGIGQLLWIEQMMRLSRNGIAAAFYWLDSRHDRLGSSFKTFGQDSICAHEVQQVSVLGKPLDYRKCLEVEDFSVIEKFGARVTQVLFSSTDTLKSPYRIERFQPNRASSCLSFIYNATDANGLSRYFSETELLRKFDFEEGPVQSLALLFYKADNLSGILYGFTNPVASETACFQIDGIRFSAGLSWKEKRAFLAAAESFMRDQLDCFSVVVPETAVPENMMKFGYIPFTQQSLVINRFDPSLNAPDFKGSQIELR